MNVGNAKAHIVHCIHILKQDHKRPVTLHIPHEALKGLRAAAFGFFGLQHQLLSRACCILAGYIFATCANYEKIYAWHAALARHVLPAISLGSDHLQNVEENTRSGRVRSTIVANFAQAGSASTEEAWIHFLFSGENSQEKTCSSLKLDPSSSNSWFSAATTQAGPSDPEHMDPHVNVAAPQAGLFGAIFWHNLKFSLDML